MLLTGNIGRHGAGVFTWAGNYKGALLQASSWSGPGVGTYTAEDPFHPVLDETARITHEHLRHTERRRRPFVLGLRREDADRRLPNGGPQVFTGKTHLPTPTKVIWYNNANFLNQAKWIYNIIVNVLPKIDMIVDQQIEWTGVGRIRRRGAAGQLLGRVAGLRDAAARARTPSSRSGKGGSSRFTTRVDDGEVFAGVARRSRRQDRRPAVCRLLQVRHREEGQSLPPASLRQLARPRAATTGPTTSTS